MGQFVKKITPEKVVYPTSIYPDLYDNNKTTTDIAIGTSGGVTMNSFMIGDFTVPDKNAFGDEKLVGAKLGLYINSITRENSASGIPGLKAYKVPVNVGNREGGKASAGSLISLQGFTQICSYHSDEYTVSEVFDGYVKPTDEASELVQDVIIKKTDPYLLRKHGYEYGERFGEGRGTFKPIGSSKHFRRYGQTLEDGTEVYKIQHGLQSDDWVSVKENKHWRRYNRERWDSYKIGGSRNYPNRYNIIKYATKETVQRSDKDEVQRVTTDNTFFDGVAEAQTFRLGTDDSNLKKIAFGDVAFSSSRSRVGGQSLHMHSIYPHRDTTLVNIHYPKGTNDNTENQQTSFVTKQLPLPVHLYSHRGEGDTSSSTTGSVNGRNKPMMSTVSMCIYLESIAPLLRRVGLAAHGGGEDLSPEALIETTQRMRLNRSVCVTFGEEKPLEGEKFYDYVKRHAPSAIVASSTGTTQGSGTNAKSFMGIAFVNDGDSYGFATLSRDYTNSTNPTGNQYTDVNFLLDSARGEVVVPTLTTNLTKSIHGKWLNLDFQFHPDGSHTFCSMYDPDTGDVHNSIASGSSTATPGVRLHNIKNVTATGGGLWAMNDATNFPRYMTVWVNNYQVIPGTYDTSASKHETGLKCAGNSSGNLLTVFASRERDSRSVFQGGASRSNSAFLNIGAGDTIITTNDDGTTASYTIVRRRASTSSGGFPAYETEETLDTKAGEKIYFDQSKFPDLNNATPMAMETSVYIDNIGFKNFNMKHNNTTPSSKNRAPSRLKIPTTYKSSPPGYAFRYSSDDQTNVKNNLADFPSYFCFGFDNISDFEGSAKYLLMNGFQTGANNEQIYQGITEVVADPESLSGVTVSNDPLSDSDTTLNVPDGSGIAVNNFIKIGSEIMKVIGRTDTDGDGNYTPAALTIVRAQDGTTAAEHANGAQVNLVLSRGELDSKRNCIRVGYTSFEDYGRQGAQDSLQRADDGGNNPEQHISKIPNPSIVFDTNGTSDPFNQRRGLRVGDLGVGDAEFSIHTNDTYNVDGFTQKGIIQWNFDRRIDSLSGITVNNNPLPAGGFTLNVPTITSGTTTLAVNNFIKIGSEIMKITAINGTAITIERGQDGTTATSHNNGAQVSLVSLPEKRESIFASARVLKVIDSNTVQVDSTQLFNLKTNEEYILYIYDDSHSSPTTGFPKTLQVVSTEEDEVTFVTRHGIDPESEFKFLISPKKYWLMVEIHNFTDGPLDRRDISQSSNGRSVIFEKTAYTNPNNSDSVVLINEPLNTTETVINFTQGDNIGIIKGDVITIDDEKMLVTVVDSSSNPSTIGVVRGVFGTTVTTHAKKSIVFMTPRRYLPEKNYDSAVLLTGLPDDSHSSLGATFNETLYNDGEYINSWDLDPFVKTDDTAIDLKDYGFGDFDEKDQSGGHLGHINLNIKNDVTTYKEIDISGVVEVDKVKNSDTFTVLLSADDPTDSYSINVDTEDGTNPFYGLAIYEDDLPKITDFKIQPNEKDPFFVDYTWNCDDDDVWYGFLHVSDENIKDQYHGALMHIPLNDELREIGTNNSIVVDQQTLTDNFIVTDAEGVGISFADAKVSTTAAFVPKFTIEGLAGNAVKFDSNDVLFVGSPDDNDDCFSSLGKEMSVVLHCINTSPNFNSGADQFILRKGQLLSNMSLDIFGRRVGITNTGQIVARVYSDGATTNSKYVELTSNTIIRKDVPLNIIVTFDANLYTGNVKLFINGRLEDQSGEVLASHAVGNNTGWIHKTDIFSGNGRLYIGAKSESMVSSGWTGTIEEIVIYDKLIYPVEVKSGQFTFTKPLEELTAETSSNAKTYNARLFVKDYHNIRGSSKEDVATTASISYRKAAFNLNGVAD